MKRHLLAGSAAVILGGATLLAVFGYNAWSLCCGRCTAATFGTLGPFGLALLALNLLAAAVLVILKLRRRNALAHQRCTCGLNLSAGWVYCPGCGTVAASSPS